MVINGINSAIQATQRAAATTGTGGAAGTTGASTGASTSASAGAAVAASGTSLGGTNFLTLMLAQLKNQDPTSPVDSNNFLNQLAELSTVQGINTLNTSFSSLSSSLVSTQAMQASSLLGHQALVSSSTAVLGSSGAVVTGAVKVAQTSSSVLLNISDAAGALVAQLNLGAQPAGLANFAWNGATGSGGPAPAGTYTLKAQVNGVAAGTAVGTYVNGTVESVTMGAGTSATGTGTAGSSGLTVNVAGLGSVPFSSVQQISN
jgi:flagellar basal-body rod modification protein FlgD